MSNYLDLCQKLARESGTISGVQPSSVASQTGRLLKVVNWVADAWVKIQNLHGEWEWMKEELPATALTIASTARYTPASWSITDLAEWITDPGAVSLYLSATGASDEGLLVFMPFDEWWTTYNQGSQTDNRPVHYSISSDGEFCPGPRPDDIYLIRGFYRQTPQTLSANGDEPNCAARFHDIIVWKALLLMIQHDEANRDLERRAMGHYNDILSAMERDELPKISLGGPLA